MNAVHCHSNWRLVLHPPILMSLYVTYGAPDHTSSSSRNALTEQGKQTAKITTLCIQHSTDTHPNYKKL